MSEKSFHNMQNLEVDIPTEIYNHLLLTSEEHGISVNELICEVI